MRRFKISYEIDTPDEAHWEDFPPGSNRIQTRLPNGSFIYRIVPQDAEIEEIKPAFEAGYYGAYDENLKLRWVKNMVSQTNLDLARQHYPTLTFVLVDIIPKADLKKEDSDFGPSVEGFRAGDHVVFDGSYGTHDKGIVRIVDPMNRRPITVQFKKFKGLHYYNPQDLRHITLMEYENE